MQVNFSLPAGPEGMPEICMLASSWQYSACSVSYSLCRIMILKIVCPSLAVCFVTLLSHGYGVFLGIITLILSSSRLLGFRPQTRMPTSSEVLSWISMPTSSLLTAYAPARMPAWIAAPRATASSGFSYMLSSFPKYSFSILWILGTRVLPPTTIISSTWSFVILASSSDLYNGSMHLLKRGWQISSNSARVISI